MPDVLADGRFGEDHGIKCRACGSKTFLSYDDGYGLMFYDCEECDESTGVQYDSCEEDEDYEPEGWEIALWEDQVP